MKKIKLSELPLYQSLKGLFTIGTNENNESVRVPLGFIEDSTDAANNAAESANNAAKNANEAAAAANEAAGAANEAAGSANKAAGDANAAAGAIFGELKKYIPRSLLGAINGVASLDAQGKVPIAQLLTEGENGLVLRSLLGAAKGVATLNNERLVWDDQLRMGWRGYYTGDIDATNIKPGIWGIDNRSLGAAILGGELAHGILVQFCDTQQRNYRTQLLLVGRNAQSANGDAVEIYARRYLPGKSGWGAWFSSAGGAQKGIRVKQLIPTDTTSNLHNPTSTPYEPFVDADGNPIEPEEGVLYILSNPVAYEFSKGDIFVFDAAAPMQDEQGYDPDFQIGRYRCIVGKSNIDTTYRELNLSEIIRGLNTVAGIVSAKTLKDAIASFTEGKATIDFVNSSIQTATATFKGSHNSLEELQAVEGADKNDYGYVEETDADGNKIIHRYKYVEDTGWVYEYDLNATGFTAAEWAAIKSGMTQEDVNKLRALPTKEQMDESMMPLKRMEKIEYPDSSNNNRIKQPSECTEPGIYENVMFPDSNRVGIYTDIPCTLYVSENYNKNNYEYVIDTNNNISYENKYRTLVQIAVCNGRFAVREYKKLVSTTNPGITIISDSQPWTFLVFKNELEKYALKSELPSMQIVSGSEEFTVPANGRTVRAIALNNIPEGYTFGAYRSLDMNSGTGDSEGFKSCAIQFYGSTDGGTKANIALKNFSNVAVTVKVNVNVLFFKDSGVGKS